ncbi:type IV secretory system conjugative DNA transfer family protein [Nocardia tengchongensis]|uniref:type IV secretory system conjugative DNA transfer family protein n=1 Tax=Nocardia tengchongensis TaxID=2055889 RepID=UPI0036C8CAC7
MDRSVKAPGQEMSPEWREVCVAAGLMVGVPGLVEVAGLSVWLAPVFGAPAQDVPLKNPAGLGWHLFATHSLAWPAEAWAGLGTLAVGSGLGVVGSVVAWRAACEQCRQLKDKAAQRKAARKDAKAARRKDGKAPKVPKALPLKPIAPAAIDSQARYMGRGAELDDLTATARAAKAAQLRVQLGEGDAPGVLVARAVLDGRELYASYEDLHLDIWGPRTGKSSSRVIPAVLGAPGAVVATSNKRDVVDATRAARAQNGDTVWVFDPQGVAAEECSWYWDPIAWVFGDGRLAGVQRRAVQLAGRFADDADDSGSRDAFFDTEGRSLLGGLILACAMAKRPITQVFEWVTKLDNDDPVEILHDAGFPLVSSALSDQYTSPVEQRGGVFSTAKKMAMCLQFEDIRPWVTPPVEGEKERRAFDVEAFVRSRDTLYPLSTEDEGSAGPLVTALCAAVADAGATEGVKHPRGRLPVPLLVVLDEAANIVKWKDLPKQYSHFGSRGIVVMTILQSWAQGVRCWGADGMTALWSAANFKVLGPGLDDAAFLRDRSELIGPHYELLASTSHSSSKSGSSNSHSTQRTSETTLHASDLAALPMGRVVLFIHGHRPVLAAPVPWWDRPYAAQIQAVIDELDNTPAHPAEQRPHLRALPSWTDDEEGKTA